MRCCVCGIRSGGRVNRRRESMRRWNISLRTWRRAYGTAARKNLQVPRVQLCKSSALLLMTHIGSAFQRSYEVIKSFKALIIFLWCIVLQWVKSILLLNIILSSLWEAVCSNSNRKQSFTAEIISKLTLSFLCLLQNNDDWDRRAAHKPHRGACYKGRRCYSLVFISADLMIEMEDHTNDLSEGRIPFLDYKTYTDRVFFLPSKDGANDVMITGKLDIPEARRATVTQALNQFSNLLNSKTFLINVITLHMVNGQLCHGLTMSAHTHRVHSSFAQASQSHSVILLKRIRDFLRF